MTIFIDHVDLSRPASDFTRPASDFTRPASDFTTDPTSLSVTDSPTLDSMDIAFLVIGVFVALGIVLSVVGTLCCWARIIRAKKLERNRRVSVVSTVKSENHIYESMDSIPSVYAQTMSPGVAFGEEHTEETGSRFIMSPDTSAPAINQLEEYYDTMQAAMSSKDMKYIEAAVISIDTNPEAAIKLILKIRAQHLPTQPMVVP